MSEELRAQGTRAQIYIVGGAAMSLAFSRDRTTDDVDARIDKGHYRLTDAVRTVGRRHGLADTWLNDQATTTIPRAADARSETLYQSSHLTVTGASTPADVYYAYRYLLRRPPDRQGFEYFQRRIRTGMSFGRFAREFGDSEEARNIARDDVRPTVVDFGDYRVCAYSGWIRISRR